MPLAAVQKSIIPQPEARTQVKKARPLRQRPLRGLGAIPYNHAKTPNRKGDIYPRISRTKNPHAKPQPFDTIRCLASSLLRDRQNQFDAINPDKPGLLRSMINKIGGHFQWQRTNGKLI
jgi:hypothetical protein